MESSDVNKELTETGVTLHTGVVMDPIAGIKPYKDSTFARQPEQPVNPLRCRDLLEKALTVDRIEFDGGNREVSAGSYGALDRVAATVERCPEALIEVAAHTDSDGSNANNLELSQARADAILEFLVDAGVKRERIAAVGHGEADPVADNSTEEGKAANRRIEFVLAVPEDG